MSTVARSWTFLAPACPRPTGGDIARFEIVNAIARGGRDHVQVVHLPTDEMQMRSLSDVPWFSFDAAVEHRFPSSVDPEDIPDADVVVYSTKLLATALAPTARQGGQRLVQQLQGERARRWLPVLFLQGHKVFPDPIEALAFQLPGPKVCVGSWLVDLVVGEGVPASDVVHIPNGIDPGVFRVVTAIDARSPAGAMNFDPHPAKRGDAGIRALEILHERQGVPSTVFGTIPVTQALPTGLGFVASPNRKQLVEGVYNAASLFLQPSRMEGFGLCAVEAMACGCALVTTENGGSADYAIDGETALVCGPRPRQMAEALERLAVDDGLRVRLARAGARHVERFRWTTSAERLVQLADEGLGRTDRYPPRGSIDLDEVIHQLDAWGGGQ